MNQKTKNIVKIIGIIVLVSLIVVSWFFGFFGIIFYLLGFYAALYFLSILFKTTAILDTIMTVGGIITYIGLAVLGLYLLYLTLNIMFTESFFWGLLLLFFGIPIAEGLLYALIMALGAPLFFFRNQVEEQITPK